MEHMPDEDLHFNLPRAIPLWTEASEPPVASRNTRQLCCLLDKVTVTAALMSRISTYVTHLNRMHTRLFCLVMLCCNSALTTATFLLFMTLN